MLSVIKKNLLEGSELSLDLEQFRQILFIKPDFYHFTERREN